MPRNAMEHWFTFYSIWIHAIYWINCRLWQKWLFIYLIPKAWEIHIYLYLYILNYLTLCQAKSKCWHKTRTTLSCSIRIVLRTPKCTKSSSAWSSAEAARTHCGKAKSICWWCKNSTQAVLQSHTGQVGTHANHRDCHNLQKISVSVIWGQVFTSSIKNL